MAEAARSPEPPPAPDRSAVDRAYRLERARRRARLEHSRASRRASVRFMVVLVLLLLCTLAFAFAVRREVQQLFGL